MKFCNELKKNHKEQDEQYMEDIMMKSLELGKKEKDKAVLLDMDETMIAAKFEGKLPAKFQTSFSFEFHETKIHVRLRPYLQDALEKIA